MQVTLSFDIEDEDDDETAGACKQALLLHVSVCLSLCLCLSLAVSVSNCLTLSSAGSQERATWQEPCGMTLYEILLYPLHSMHDVIPWSYADIRMRGRWTRPSSRTRSVQSLSASAERTCARSGSKCRYDPHGVASPVFWDMSYFWHLCLIVMCVCVGESNEGDDCDCIPVLGRIRK